MGCGQTGNIITGVLSGGVSAIPDQMRDSYEEKGFFANDPNGPAGPYEDPLVTEAKRVLSAYRQIAPLELQTINEFSPQYAKAYGNTLAATYEGTLKAYETQISPALSRVNSAQRAADIGDVSRYGAQSRQAILDSNPDTAQLLAKLNADANTGLDAGTGLTPAEMRQMQQASRAASAARGMNGSNSAVADELLRQYQLGNTRQQQRQALASHVIGLNQQVVGDPFMQILGRSGQAIGAANNLMQQGQGQVSQSGAGNLYDPFKDAYSQMFHNDDIKAAKDAANKQMIGAIAGGALSGLGGIAGAAI